jgi:hypothetical protein
MDPTTGKDPTSLLIYFSRSFSTPARFAHFRTVIIEFTDSNTFISEPNYLAIGSDYQYFQGLIRACICGAYCCPGEMECRSSRAILQPDSRLTFDVDLFSLNTYL